MALLITYHRDRPADGAGFVVDALGPQDGDAVSVASAANHTFGKTGLYRLKATADHVIRFGDVAASTGGETWSNGDKEVRYFRSGQKAYVD